jgi:ankyrin repeat protein
MAVLARENAIELVEFLLASGADINAKSDGGITPLDYAGGNTSRQAVVDLLKKHGAICRWNVFDAIDRVDVVSLNVLLKSHPWLHCCRDNGENTPLHRATQMASKEMVTLLLANNADPNARNETGATPIAAAISWRAQAVTDSMLAACIEVLIANGADVNAVDQSGCTPLDRAAGNYLRALEEVLRKHGGYSPSNPTSNLNRLEKMLDQDPAFILWRDGHKETLLHNAAAHGYMDALVFLISKGIDVNVTNQSGETPLHQAAVRGYADVVSLLLARGAYVYIRDNAGKSAIDHAVWNPEDNQQVVRILLNAGCPYSQETALRIFARFPQ